MADNLRSICSHIYTLAKKCYGANHRYEYMDQQSVCSIGLTLWTGLLKCRIIKSEESHWIRCKFSAKARQLPKWDSESELLALGQKENNW